MKERPSLPQRVLAFIRRERLMDAGDHLLVAVSGGPDSVALLHVLAALAPNLGIDFLTVAHFDHHLRGSESDEDRRFVRDLARDLGIPCIEGEAAVLDHQRSRCISLEMAARECRHRFFRETLERTGCTKLALGHTADDQAEELVLRIIRGTGVSGLAGMPPRTTAGIVRPLLFATRRDILDYLGSGSISFREDSSNASPFCRRNVLRQKVFPVLEDVAHPGVRRTLARLADRVRDEERFWLRCVEGAWRECCHAENEGRLALDVIRLSALDPALLRRLFRYGWERLHGSAYGIEATHIEAMCALAARPTPGGHVRLPGGYRAWIESGQFILSRHAQALSPSRLDSVFVHEAPASIVFGTAHLVFDPLEETPSAHELRDASSPRMVFLDAACIEWPLQVRPRSPGDRFRPMGSGGSRKLHDYFVDAKVPREERDHIPILCDREKILWVAGHRLDDRVKVTPETRRILRIRMFEVSSSPEST